MEDEKKLQNIQKTKKILINSNYTFYEKDFSYFDIRFLKDNWNHGQSILKLNKRINTKRKIIYKSVHINKALNEKNDVLNNKTDKFEKKKESKQSEDSILNQIFKDY